MRRQGRCLERSCADRLRVVAPADWLTLLEGRFAGQAYDRHRHDTYAIGVTLAGVQEFSYRGALHASTPGDVIVLAPDEPHDGHAGDAAGFAYRMLYLAPDRIASAIEVITGESSELPRGGQAVARDPALAAVIGSAFARFPAPPEPLLTEEIVLAIAEALLRRRGRGRRRRSPLDHARLERARALLEEDGAVNSAALEAATGLDRFTLARQFRIRFGISPSRYRAGCRQRRALALVGFGTPLAAIAQETGFADQPHMTRAFKASFGLPPGRLAALLAAGG